MSRYAEKTSVSAEKSRAEIERTLTRYGASEFLYGWKNEQALVGFKFDDRYVQFILPLPDKKDEEFTHTPGRKRERNETQAYAAWEQACRQRWRALALCIKAKLEAVEAGITTFEQEFLAHIVLPDKRTVGDWLIPQIALAYEEKKMPPLLPLLEGKRK